MLRGLVSAMGLVLACSACADDDDGPNDDDDRPGRATSLVTSETTGETPGSTTGETTGHEGGATGETAGYGTDGPTEASTGPGDESEDLVLTRICGSRDRDENLNVDAYLEMLAPEDAILTAQCAVMVSEKGHFYVEPTLHVEEMGVGLGMIRELVATCTVDLEELNISKGQISLVLHPDRPDNGIVLRSLSEGCIESEM